MSHGWSAEPLNLLSPEIVKRVRQALEAGAVCGLHAFYGVGCGREPCAFIDFDSYELTVDRSRPGDWFTLWSIPMLAEHGCLLLWKQKAPITETELETIKRWLKENTAREFIAVGFSTDSNLPAAMWGDYDTFDKLGDLAHKCAANGEFAVLPLTDLLVKSDLHRWLPRLHLIDAKRPNDRAEVPLGGSY